MNVREWLQERGDSFWVGAIVLLCVGVLLLFMFGSGSGSDIGGTGPHPDVPPPTVSTP